MSRSAAAKTPSLRLLLAGLVLTLTCGGTAHDAAEAAFTREVAVSVPKVVRPPRATVSATSTVPLDLPRTLTSSPFVATPRVGLLANAAALSRFFEALARLDGQGNRRDVRIVQLGDSHTASDYETGAMRRALQARFGDGGRGFVALGEPWKKYRQEGVHTGSSREFQPERGKLEKGHFVGDGRYGLGGLSLATTRRGTAWTEVSAPTTRIELSYLEQPRGGTFELLVDGKHQAFVSSRRVTFAPALRALVVPEGPHRVDVRTFGDGAVRLLGVAFDGPGDGVVLDALGINGARAASVLRWDEAHWRDALRARSPDLVILAYGTNESADNLPIATHERELVELLGRVARAVPSASCLLLGPPDRAIETADGWATSARVAELAESQRRIAVRARCASLSQLDGMGIGAIARWAEEVPPRAQPDRVHLTRDGYEALGAFVAGELVTAYASFRTSRGLAPGRGPAAIPRAERDEPGGDVDGSDD